MIADFHNDVLTAPRGGLRVVSEQTKACVCAAFGGGRSFADICGQVEALRRAGRKNLYLSLEDAYYLNERCAEEVCGWDPVCVSLTWNAENSLAGGCLSDSGMTLLGRAMTKRLSDAGIALDCAHLCAESFCDLLDCAALVVDSHTCLCGVYPHPRNLQDWQVQEIVRRGGLIGITFVGRFLTDGYADARAVFRHIDYGVQKFGTEHFCLGSDFHGTQDLPHDLARYADTDHLCALFYKAGYPQDTVDALMFGNLLRFLRRGERSV